MPEQRLGVVRRDDLARKRDIGKVLPIGMEVRVGRLRNSRERVAAVSG
jgi:hypothetical protein